MTKREVLTAIVEGRQLPEIVEWAKDEIVKMDKANDARKEKASKKAAENQPLMDKIYEDILGETPVTATMVGEAMEFSTQKASALLRKLVAEGKACVTDVKIAKKGTQKGYTKA